MSNYLKFFKTEFEKYAQDIGSPPSRPSRRNTGGAPAPTRGHGASGVFDPPTKRRVSNTPVVQPNSSNTDIMTMQHALQELAQDVSSQINLQDAFSGDPQKEQEAKARDAFGVFLTKNYMRNTKVPGVEYDPNPKITDISQKNPNDPTRMSIVMDTMNRVGNPKKGEHFVDGHWGPRTNAALRDVYAFASGLLSFVNDLNRFADKKLYIKSYTSENLSALEQYAQIDANALSMQQKIAAAPELTKHIKAIKNMYDEVKNKILQHPNYQRFIEGSDSFKSYQPKVNQQQIDLLKKSFPQGIDLTFKDFATKISIDDLVNLDALKAWISHALPSANLNPQDVISQIWKQQGKLLGSDPGY